MERWVAGWISPEDQVFRLAAVSLLIVVDYAQWGSLGSSCGSQAPAQQLLLQLTSSWEAGLAAPAVLLTLCPAPAIISMVHLYLFSGL